MSRKQGGLHGVPDRFNLSRVVDRGSNPVDRARGAGSEARGTRGGFRWTGIACQIQLDGFHWTGFTDSKASRFLCGTQAGSIRGG